VFTVRVAAPDWKILAIFNIADCVG
jgi:hypothetical protein